MPVDRENQNEKKTQAKLRMVFSCRNSLKNDGFHGKGEILNSGLIFIKSM
jgi:hypothetical protein